MLEDAVLAITFTIVIFLLMWFHQDDIEKWR